MLAFFALLFIFPLASPETIANLFEWSHADVAAECTRFLKTYGYDAVQLAPVNECAVISGNPWWERYQPFSYKLISRSGNEDDFRNMVVTCNNAGIKVYVDVVFNHMSANLPSGTLGTGGSVPDTVNKDYPDVPYRAEHFHESCNIDDWNNKWQIRNCELASLHDLNQTTDYVREMILGFLNKLVDIGVAGFRVDAAKHMEVADLRYIYDTVHNLNTTWFPQGSRPYYFQEVQSATGDILPVEVYTPIGGCLDFKYCFELSRAFQNWNQLKWFKNYGTDWKILPWKDSVVFIDNHDTQRTGIFGINSLNYKQSKKYKMATGFMLAWPYERAAVMSSFDFAYNDQGPPSYPVTINEDLSCSGGWICEHRWRQIYNMVGFANQVKGTEVTDWWDNGSYQISFCRGQKGFVAFNAELSGDLNASLQTCLPSGEYCDVVSGTKSNGSCTGTKVTVEDDGKANISIPNSAEDGFLAIHLGSKL